MAADVETRIERFTSRLGSALGENLRSLTLYGSAARGQHIPGRSDINLLLIVRDASAGALHPAADSLGQWHRDGETPPLIFSEDEWKASADVFPLEMEDMRDAHRMILGADPLHGITTERTGQRHQLERELRGKLLHLRTGYAAAARDPRALGRLLENSLSSFLVLFRGVLRLKGAPTPADAAGVIRETAKVAGFPAAAFEWALAARSGQAPPALKAMDPLAAQYVDAVQQLARIVNGL